MDKIEYSRLLIKRSTTPGETPTIPPVTAVTLNQFTPTDLFEGEFFLNSFDDLLWIRTENGILPISLSGSTGTTVNPTLTQVLYEGDDTGGFDIVVSSGDTIVFQGIPNISTPIILGLDSTGGTVTTTVSSDSLWTSGVTIGSLTSLVGNNINTQRYSVVAGVNNNLSNETGYSGVTSGSTIIVGLNNTVVDKGGNAVFGQYHTLSNSSQNLVGGYGQNLSNVSNNLSVGTNNTITAGQNNAILGLTNTINSGSGNLISGNSNKIISTVSNSSAIIGSYQSALSGSNTSYSVVIGGQGITGITNNMVYVPNLTIVSATTGSSISSLGIDSTGKVIKTQDVYTTGGTYNMSDGGITFTRNDGETYVVNGIITTNVRSYPQTPTYLGGIGITGTSAQPPLVVDIDGTSNNSFYYDVFLDHPAWTGNRSYVINLNSVSGFTNGDTLFLGLNFIQDVITGTTRTFTISVTDKTTNYNFIQESFQTNQYLTRGVIIPITVWGNELFATTQPKILPLISFN